MAAGQSQPIEVQIPGSDVTRAQGRRERTAAKAGVRKGEKPHRAGVGERIGGAVIAGCPDRQPVPGRVERDGDAEPVVGLKSGAEVEIVCACIAPAEGRRERAAAKAGVRKGEQPHRAGLGGQIAEAVVAGCPDRQPVPGSVQR